MSKQRFRDVKKGKLSTDTKDLIKKKIFSNSNEPLYAPSALKIKAFLTDAFMLLMPILYIVIYFVMGGRGEFESNMLTGWIYILIPLIITQTIFMYKTGQTPGYRAYNIKLIDIYTLKKPSLFNIFFRNMSAILSLFTLLGWALMFFRKDNKNLHDLLSSTVVVYDKASKDI